MMSTSGLVFTRVCEMLSITAFVKTGANKVHGKLEELQTCYCSMLQ